MKNLRMIALGLVIAATITVVRANNDTDTALLTQISGYRQWTKINPEPVKVEVPSTSAAGEISLPPEALS